MAALSVVDRRHRPRWVWPLLAVPPAAVALSLASAATLAVLLIAALLAVPWIRFRLEQRRAEAAAGLTPLQLAWLAGGPHRALDVAMTRLLGLGTLQWVHDARRDVWLYRPVPGVVPPAEVDLLHRLCAGGAEPWQLHVLTPGALGAAQWSLVARGWWVDRWASRWARFWSSLPLLMVGLAGLAQLPSAEATGPGTLLPGLLALAVPVLIGNAAWAPARTRGGTRALAAAAAPPDADPVETLCWAVARDGPSRLVGTPAEDWWQIRRTGADRRP